MSDGVTQCQATTYEAEAMTHSTGGAITGGWNLWSNGYLTTSASFTAGQITITVIAKGDVAAGVWPHMRVSVGGTEIGNTYVTSSAWASYAFTATVAAGAQELRITYDNDYLSSTEDRNLMVDKATVGCPAATLGGKPYPSGVAYRGINRAGLEYGDDWDGWTGQTYFDQPSHTQITTELAYFKAKGMNVIRLPISWERLQHQLYGALTQSYVTLMTDYINTATAAGFVIVLDLHNYNRFAVNAYNASGTQVSGYTQHTLYDGTLTLDHLRDVWVKLVGVVGSNPSVILNLMNESHDFNRTSNGWFADLNTLIAAIRAAGSTQLILVPNSRSSDVTHWSSYAPNGGDVDAVAALAITDSANNYAYDMHAYLDAPSSCSAYSSLVTEVTTWATTNHKRLFLSELGASTSASNGACAISSLLSYLNSHADVWLGWTPWDLSPYNLTSGHTADGPEMPWYTPSLTPNYLP